MALERDELRIVNDQRGSPTWSRLLAEGTAAVLARLIEGDGFRSDFSGVYHLVAQGETTWYGFACAALEADPARNQHRCRAVRAITSEEYPTLVQRPQYSVLDTSKLAATFGVALPDWQEQLSLCLS